MYEKTKNKEGKIMKIQRPEYPLSLTVTYRGYSTIEYKYTCTYYCSRLAPTGNGIRVTVGR